MTTALPLSRPRVSIFDRPAVPAQGGSGRYLYETLPTPEAAAEDTGSRRRKLWELPPGTLCPLMGVCLPLATLRRVLARTVGGELGDDYQVHCAAINECTHRSPTCEALQRELDLRHALALQRFGKAKTTEAMAALWHEESAASDPSGALWAGLTHPRCDSALRERICGDIHMLQHQLGAGNRADLLKFEALAAEHAALKRELAATQERQARALAERDRRQDTLAAELLRLRADAIQKDSRIAVLADELARVATPASRIELDRARARTHELERDLADARRNARTEARRADELAARLAQATADARLPDAPTCLGTENVTDTLRDAAVLCVGGRTASVPIYRRLIEVTGGRFAHHDGGEQQSVSQLEASLNAADLVICQTGCISHDAYWRVKDHCKRTGKRCVFVDNPSASSFARSLRAMPERA